MKPVRVTPAADKDLDACYAWIKRDNPRAARRFLQAVRQTNNELAYMPGIGSPRYADLPLAHGVRMIAVRGFEHYLIFYLERETVEVIRVIHGARDIPAALLLDT
jgi:toxin ParE1/3/4